MATRQEAQAAIDAASAAMRQAIEATMQARRLAIESGLLTADDVIAEGMESLRAEVFAGLPAVAGYIGTTSTAADVEAVHWAREEVIAAAKAAGQVLALLVKVAIAAAAAA